MAVEKESSVLLLFTGGTISMSEDPSTGALRPIDFDRLQEYMPEIKQTGIRVKSVPFLPLIDSSDVDPSAWERMALLIEENYEDFDGFVVLHGTDTMAYSASALSFMLENLSKPVIFTGAQLPIGMMRSDAKENLLTAIEIASAKENGQPIVPEVCIFFEDTLFRGNRTTKKKMPSISRHSIRIITRHWPKRVCISNISVRQFIIRQSEQSCGCALILIRILLF